MLRGAGEDSGILLAESLEEFAAARRTTESTKANPEELSGNEFPLLHPEHFRLPDEAARHKILDLIGDLALSGQARGLALPKLRLTVRNGGHALNHLLLDHLQIPLQDPSRSDPS
jgi:hypothetical protein